MIHPDTLAGWTLDHLRDLVQKGTFEPESFDFKEMLPGSKDEKGKARLVEACASFANSKGGFLIFGIKDSRLLQVDDRIVGVAATIDFPAHFGDFPSKCRPSVSWDFKNPPLALPSGNVVHIVHIPRSWDAPHGCETANKTWRFKKRTNKGVEDMTYDEVRMMFLGFYEKMIKLQLLRAELVQICNDAGVLSIPPEQNDGSRYALPTFELRVLETMIADTYSITHSQPRLLECLAAMRPTARNANNAIASFRMQVALPVSNKQQIVKDHNDFLRPICQKIIELSQQAIGHLDEILAQ